MRGLAGKDLIAREVLTAGGQSEHAFKIKVQNAIQSLLSIIYGVQVKFQYLH